MATVYAIPALIESQKKPVQEHCFGDCGKVSVGGAIEMPEVGPCWVCPSSDCPYEVGHTDPVGTSQLTGDEVCIRGLRTDSKGE